MKIIKPVLLAAITVTIISGCEKNQEGPSGTDYSHGIYIVNEGGFMASNGSISFFDPSAGQITNSIFESANNRPLGDVVQSLSVVGDTTGYIVVNGSGKVEIVRLKDFKSSSEPISVLYPRYFLQVGSNKGYLTGGSMQGWVYEVNLLSREITDSTMVGYGPETMIRRNNQVFVINSGGWSVDSTISVLDLNTDQVTSSINVGKVPSDMAMDSDDNLWVYCKGYAEFDPEPPYNMISETDALLQQIDPVSGNILWQQSVGKAGDYGATPPKLAVSKEGDRIFYLRPEGVFAISTHNPVISASVLIPGEYYGLEVNPADGNIYLFVGAGFTGNGSIRIHDTTGNLIGQGVVGIAPNGAAFNLEQ